MANEAWSLGWQTGTKLAADQRARKEMLVDEERKTKVADLFQQRDNIVKTLPYLKDTDPAAYKQAQDTLDQIHTGVEQIYHPVQNPGALQKDWHWLAGLIHKTPPPHAVLSTTTAPGEEIPATPEAKLTLPDQEITVPGSTTKVLGPNAQEITTVSPDVVSRWSAQANLPATPATRAPVRTTVSTKPAAMTPQQRQGMAQREKARAETAMDVASSGLTPEQESQAKTKATVLEATETSKALYKQWEADNPGASEDEKKNARNEIWDRTVLGITGSSYGRQAKPDLQSLKLSDNTTTSAQWDADRKVWTYMDGSVIPAHLVRGATVVGKPVKKIRLGVVPSPQSPTKFAVIWGDPSNPSDQGAWQWTPIGPTRYQQIINSDSTAKDAFGVITTTSRVTGPQAQGGVNLTGIGQGSDLFQSRGEAGAVDVDEAAAGAPAAPAPAPAAGPPTTSTPRPAAAAAPTPQQLRSQVPSQAVVTDPSAQVGTYNNPLPLDGTGHVPDGALMKNGTPMPASMKGAIDRLLDGGDIDKTVSPKDKNAVYDEAQRYGFEQGLFTPKDKLLIREAGSFLNSMQKASSLKVLDSWASRQKLHNAIKAVDGKGGIFTDQIALAFDLTPQENDFLQRFLQARGTVGGLTQLTRGGRTTEAGIKRLQSELPDPLITHSSKFAHIQLQRLLQEITVAQKQGFVADVEADKPTSQTAPPAGAGRVPQLTQQIQQLLQP